MRRQVILILHGTPFLCLWKTVMCSPSFSILEFPLPLTSRFSTGVPFDEWSVMRIVPLSFVVSFYQTVLARDDGEGQF